jgi:hypothetical protein
MQVSMHDCVRLPSRHTRIPGATALWLSGGVLT